MSSVMAMHLRIYPSLSAQAGYNLRLCQTLARSFHSNKKWL
jgi:hypothetical protein